MTESIDQKVARLAQKVFKHLEGSMSATFSWQGNDPDSYTLALHAHNQKTIDLIAADLRTELSAAQAEPVAMVVADETGYLSTEWAASYIPNRGDKFYLVAPPSPSIGGEVTDAEGGWQKIIKEMRQGLAAGGRSISGNSFELEYGGSLLDHLAEKLADLDAATPTKPDAKDAELLDFMMDNLAWIQAVKLDHPVTRYQCWTQDEDENYIVLSGKDKSFATKREAVAAAIASTKPSEGKP